MAHMDEFLAHIDPTLAPSSRLTVRKCLWSLRRGLKGEEPTTDNLFRWLRSRLATDKVSPATLQIERTYANKFFNWCIDMQYMDRNPLKPIPHVPVPVVNKPTITDEQFNKLEQADSEGIWRPLLVVSWYTGARLVDLCNLQWADINWETSTLRFIPQKTKRSGRVVELPLIGPLLNCLKNRYELVKDTGVSYVFPDLHILHSRADGTIQKVFRQLCDRAGLPKSITFHCFRHTRATRMLNGDEAVNPMVAADVLGITNLTTLRRYNHTSQQAKQKAMTL